jgi:hypothetical protein
VRDFDKNNIKVYTIYRGKAVVGTVEIWGEAQLWKKEGGEIVGNLES